MKIYILNTLEQGLLAAAVLSRRLPISGVIGLSKRCPTDSISGYLCMQAHCQDFIAVKSYSLSNPMDKKTLLSLDMDFLLVTGWQRLIPCWLIEHCHDGIIGAHGSPWGITRGRGRSPQNWALLLGHTTFSVSIFQVDEGIDSGPVIATREIDLDAWDDIKTSHYKVSLAVADMMANCIEGDGLEFLSSQTGVIRYCPQRLPEDGEIGWHRTSVEIYNFVRALTKPYPGAFCYNGEDRVVIWRGRPMIYHNSSSCKPGEVIMVFPNGDVLVKTHNAAFLVENYEAAHQLQIGDVLSSCDFGTQMGQIIERHNIRHPSLPISEEILCLGART